MLDKEKELPIEQITAKSARKQERGKRSLDDKFITAYCERPMDGKTAALIKAGFVGDNIPQEAYRMFKRLADQIKQRTSELIESLDVLAANQLQSILQKNAEDVGYSNMSKAIQQGMDYSGRKVGDVLTIKKEQSIDDIDSEIEQLQQSINKTEGKELH